MKGFISYAHKDKEYFDLLVEGIKAHAAGSQVIEWKMWTDKAILIGEDWHETIQEAIEESEFAILLLSADFFNSEYIQEHEFSEFISRKKQKGYLIFPILLSDFDFKKFESISKYQFFKASGADYGFPKEEIIPFDRLVEFQNNGQPKPNSYRNTYYKNLVKAIERSISNHNYRKISPKKDALIRTNYGLHPDLDNLTPLQKAIQALDFKSPMLRDLHRVNCDRVNLIGDFWRFVEKNKKSNCLFFSIIANELHQPESFSERLVYELDEEFSEKGLSIYYKPHPVYGIDKHKIELHFEDKAKRDFKRGFSKMSIPEQHHTLIIDSLEDFNLVDSPAGLHDYVAVIFTFDLFYKHIVNFNFKSYFEWIRNSFCQGGQGKPKFLFFLVFNLQVSKGLKQTNKDLIKKIKNATGKQRTDSLFINKFSDVKTDDLARWFSNHLATKVEVDDILEEIFNDIDKRFSTKRASKLFNKETESFQMDFVQKVLNDVCKLRQ